MGGIEAWAESARGRLLAGKYKLLELLGSGGMGAVFVAEDLTLGRRVAVKVMRPSRRGEDGAERFRREARAAARVGGDGVVQVLEFDFDAELGPFQVLELLEGESLSGRLKRGALPPPDAIELALALTRTLERVHAERIVHRDIKPANIFLEETPEGQTRVKLLDFGIARMAEQGELTVPGTRIGTPGFMAPEQLRGHEVGPAADVYALGVLMHTCLLGEPPFADMIRARIAVATLDGTMPALSARAPWLSAELTRLVGDARALDPLRRPSATELVARLAALHTAPISAPPPRRLASTLMSNEEPSSYAIPDTADPVPGEPPVVGARSSERLPPSSSIRSGVARPAQQSSVPPALAPRTSSPAAPVSSPSPRGWLMVTGGLVLLLMAVIAFAGGWVYSESITLEPHIGRTPTGPVELEPPPPQPPAPTPTEPESGAEDEHLVAIRSDLVAGEVALTSNHIEEAIRAFERGRDHLSTLPVGIDRALARDIHIGLGDAHLAAIERDAPLGSPGACQERITGHQVAAGAAYQQLHTLGDANLAQLAQMRRGSLFERIGELCGTRNRSRIVRNAYLVGAEVEYEAAAASDGPLRAEASRSLARVRAMMR